MRDPTTWKDVLQHALRDIANWQTKRHSGYTMSQVLAWMITVSRRRTWKRLHGHHHYFAQSSLAVLIKSCFSQAQCCREEDSCNPALYVEQAFVLLHGQKIATLRMRVRETGMPRRRASVAQRGHHASGNVVLNTLSQHRLQSPRQKGSLQQLRVQPRTRCKHRDAVVAFSAWLRDEGQSPSSCENHVDAQLCEYLEWLWREGAHVGWAGDAISGCQFLMQKKRYFPAAWELLRTWKREELPLPNCFCTHGNNSRMECNRCGSAHCHRVRCFSANDGSAHTAKITNHSAQLMCFLTLPITKTGKRTGETQSVIIDDPLLDSIINRSANWWT